MASARMRRLASDFEEVRKNFAGHKSIIVTPIGEEPAEKYHVTYFVNGIYLKEDGAIEALGRHEVDIVLHADYPRYKPLCSITTPIWHPNFRDGQICIGDIWGAGESLSDIIINIGDMIQYKSWNSSSPLSADAAKWAVENKHLFPVGNIDLNFSDYASAADDVEIDLFDDDGNLVDESDKEKEYVAEEPEYDENRSSILPEMAHTFEIDSNDFDITAEELEGITFVPTAQRMQSVRDNVVKSQKVNFKTVFMKGLLWALIGSIVGFVLQEVLSDVTDTLSILKMMGYSSIYDIPNTTAGLSALSNAVRISSALFVCLIAFALGLFMGIGEGVFYGSKNQAIKYGAMGAGISLGLGFLSGYIAQWLYSALLSDSASTFSAALVRGIGWAIMGVGIGVSIGLIKPEKKRVLYCAIGGAAGGFIGGFLFNFIANVSTVSANDTGTVPRAIGIIIMGCLIGLGIGLLEQFAKQAWLKVIRGEFEGKEYLVFAGTTSIGNNGKNTIVLFKDKLVGPHHCDIVLEGSKYVLLDCGTPMGTVVNGQKISRVILKHGDTIALGNTVLVFNTK